MLLVNLDWFSPLCQGPALLASGEPPKVVQERSGHHTTAFTQDAHQHLRAGMGAAAARRFENLVLGPGDGPRRTGDRTVVTQR